MQFAQTLWARLTIIYLPPLALLYASGVAAARMPISTRELTRDPTAIAGVPFYYGAISVVGVLMWCAAASVCAVAFLTLRLFPQHQRSSRLFMGAFCFSAALMLDDAFLIHERFGPFHLGLPSSIFYLAYAATFLFGLIVFRDLLLNRSLPILVLAMVFFSISVLIDAANDAFHIRLVEVDFVEDASKLMGIAGYLGYLCELSVNHLAALISSRPLRH